MRQLQLVVQAALYGWTRCLIAERGERRYELFVEVHHVIREVIIPRV